jgi:DNA-binding MarR family transcriptional regulator
MKQVDKKGYTTYDIGILQSSAYRKLQSLSKQVLKNHELTPNMWAVLGVLFHQHEKNSGEVSASKLAEKLELKLPFMTKTLATLQQGGWITVRAGKVDARIKNILLTKRAHKKIPFIEKEVKSEMRKLLGSIEPDDMRGYISTLQHITSK